METLVAICLGISLSAASGFRIFVPPLVMSIASLYGNLELAPGFAWVGTYPALIAFAIATVLEIAAYYLPVVDNLIDTLEVPTSLVVGTLISASILGDLEPLVQWSIAVIGGGGTAGIVEGFTTVTRFASTGLTGGLGNPLLSTMEVISSTVLSILALLLPALAAILVLGILWFGLRKLLRALHRQRTA